MTPSQISKGYYTTLEGQIHYRYLLATSESKAQSPVLLCHMSACSGLYFEELLVKLAAEGHDVYAPDIPGFGGSYNPSSPPENIRYYVEIFMLGIKHFGLTKFHVLGHHSGSSIATEMAAVYPEQILSLTSIGPALLTRDEQIAYLKQEVHPYNQPVMDGSHIKKTWDMLLTNGEWDVKDLHEQTLDAVRAWAGRLQLYTCVFNQPAMDVFRQVKCPVLALCAPDDSLYPKFGRVKEILPTATALDVKGVDFEPLRDAEGILKAMMDFFKTF